MVEQAQKYSVNTDSIQPRFNPFPGLRPFTIQESHLFFGREGQSADVLKNLSENKFVAVIGASGSGKSSLMYCGLVPVLHGGFVAKAGAKWKIMAMRPGNGPIQNLAEALAKNAVQPAELAGKTKETAPIIESILKNSSYGLCNAVQYLERPKNENILLLVDQFEELFRFKKKGRSLSSVNEALNFINLLVEAVQQNDVPIYVVLTMRSDFIGECAQYQSLTKLINKSHYLIPQMTRDNLQKAIEGPVAVGGGVIAARLLHQLLNDVGDNPDQLPILQHALMRTWNYWEKHRKAGEPMDLAHYNAIGRMHKALSEHANEAFDELDMRGRGICEHLFKCLTERGADNRGIRRPSSIHEIAGIASASESEIIAVADVFRKSGRSFIAPSIDVELKADTVIDISHESLMRIWDKLIVWVEEEASAVQMYRRLSDSANRYSNGEAGLWRPPDLHLATSWKTKQKPTLQWAMRYNPAFEQALVFLNASEEAYVAEEQNKVRLQKRALRRSRTVALLLGFAAIVSLGVMVFAIDRMGAAQKAQQDALMSEMRALSEKDKADSLRVVALAETEKASAEELRARENAKEALLQKEEALRQKQFAEEQRLIALKKSNEANMQKRLAEQNSREAIAQKAVAENAKEQAFRLRMLSVARSMAVKSLQIEGDTDQKSAIAYSSFVFNDEYGGTDHDNDIYNALYYALKLKKGTDFSVLSGHDDAVRSLLFYPNSNIIYSAGSDGRVLLWGADRKPNTIFKTTVAYKQITINATGDLLACSKTDGTIEVAQLNTERPDSFVLKGHKGIVQKIEFVGNGAYVVSAGMDSTLRIWDVYGKKSQIIKTYAEPIRSLDISPDKKNVVAGLQSGTVVVGSLSSFDLNATYQSVVSFTAQNPVYEIRFSHSGNIFVTGDKLGNVILWQTENGSELYKLRGHKARISGIEFSPVSDLLATASYDGTVQLWNTTDYSLAPIVLKDHESWVQSIAFSPDGTHLITGCSDSKIKNWLINTADLAGELSESLARNMTKEEWTQFVGNDVEYRKLKKDLP